MPWAVIFPLYDCRSLEVCSAAVPRHPSQLYEFTFGLFVLLSLYLADRWAGRERRPLGMMTGIFLSLYFLGRFFMEYIKEYQVDGLVIHSARSCKPYSVGQYDLKRLLMERLEVPSVIIEADITDSRAYSEEQTRTRLEAFFEAVEG